MPRRSQVGMNRRGLDDSSGWDGETPLYPDGWGPKPPPQTQTTDWTIGNNGTDYGFLEAAYGLLAPTVFAGGTVTRLGTASGGDALFIYSDDGEKLGDEDVIFVSFTANGTFYDVACTWGGAFYFSAGNAQMRFDIVAEDGNTLSVDYRA